MLKFTSLESWPCSLATNPRTALKSKAKQGAFCRPEDPMLARVTAKKQHMKPEPSQMTWVMPSRLQTKLTSSDALRGITGWGEPVAQQSSWTTAPYCSPGPRDHSPQLLWRYRCAGLYHTRTQKGRRGPKSSGDTLFMAAPSICQTSRQGLPSSQGLWSMLPQGPGWGSLQRPPHSG